MTHYNIVAGELRLGAVECFCAHPDMENNCCPTGAGECAECEFCKVTLSCRDFDSVLRIANGKVGSE